MAVTNDLATDRRVLRHAETLREAGYEVVLLGRNEVPTRYNRGWRFYLEFNIGLRRKLRELKSDVVWANDTDTLLGCYWGVKSYELRVMSYESGVRRSRLVLDCHELFPEVPEIQHKPFVKWVWRTIEKHLMPKCDALLTVCQSIADHYKEKYGVKMTVVRNLPSGKRKVESGNIDDVGGHLSTLLYQGKVNLGRGVDWAIDAMEFLPDCRLVVAGDGDLLEQMKAYAEQKPWKGRLVFTGRLKPEELERLTPQADVGLVMLEDLGLSYHYALPNRIGDFVQAGVPMVVSDLPEMATVVRKFGVGEVIECRPQAVDRKAKVAGLTEAVKKVLEKGRGGYDFTAAREDMDWNKEKKKLIGLLSCEL